MKLPRTLSISVGGVCDLGENDFGNLGEVSDAAGEPREDSRPPRYHAVQDGHLGVREKDICVCEIPKKTALSKFLFAGR